jgi:hypothetical protein
VPFSALFLHLIQFGCSYCPPKVAYHLRYSKKIVVNFSGFYGSLSSLLKKGEKREEKGEQKGREKGNCE